MESRYLQRTNKFITWDIHNYNGKHRKVYSVKIFNYFINYSNKLLFVNKRVKRKNCKFNTVENKIILINFEINKYIKNIFNLNRK